MSRSLSILGHLCIALGLAALGIMVLGPRLPVAVSLEPQITIETLGPAPPVRPAPRVAVRIDDPEHLPRDEGDRPITRVRAPAGLVDSLVARAPFVPGDSGGTWSVPDDRVGHAENTADAGAPGNAVLFGHVSWKGLPGVFKNLYRLKPGDGVEVWSNAQGYRYRVASVQSTGPDDPTALEAATSPVLTLVTCDGLWLPHIWDYSSRLVVRAEMATPREPGLDEAAMR
jgi:LPXTG-site transpeptidase (sortase) family protein